MQKQFFTFLFFLIAEFSFAQMNLVPNPSFEVYDTCPNNVGQIYYATPWFNPNQGTTDYLNTCDAPGFGTPQNFWGNQTPHSGNAYAGFIIYLVDTDPSPQYREYAEVRLGSTLQAGVKYFVSFYLSLADSENFATDAIGACFSSDTIRNDTLYEFLLSHTPQVENTPGNFLTNKLGWTKVHGNFIAQGGENFLTIGNFKDRANTDTVGVNGGASPPISDWGGGYYYLDDVCVSTDSIYAENWTGIQLYSEYQPRIYPSLASTVITVENIPKHSTFSIIGMVGREIQKGELKEQSDQISVALLPNGIYFLILNNENTFKIIVNH